MKKIFLSVALLMLSGASLWAGGWGVAPPATATQGASISGVSAWGTSATPYGSYAPGFLVAWYRDPSNAWHGLSVIGAGGYAQRIPTSGFASVPSFTVSSTGIYTVAVYSSTSSSTAGSPTGSLEVQQSITVSSTNIPPTISWYHANPLPGAGVSYTVQALGSSSTGNLYSVFVWKDGTPFAFNGVSSPFTSRISDPNLLSEPEGTTHTFTAQATNSNGQTSPVISLTIKVTNQPTYADLSANNMVNNNPNNPGGVGQPWLPCTGNIVADTARLKNLITNLSYNSAVRTIQFEDKTYVYNAIPDPNPHRFENVSNLTILGGVNGQTTLNWGIRDQYGVPYDPAYYPNDFTLVDANYPNGLRPAWNPKPIDPNKQPTEFFYFGLGCSNISVRRINFDTDYTIRIGGEGTHIKMHGTNNEVIGCYFYHATGFAVHVGQDSRSSSQTNIIRINDNHFINTWADGLHVDNSNNVTILNNTFNHTGDDAIAITSEGVSLGGVTPTQIHVYNNLIQNTHWRGIAVLGATNVDLLDNRVIGTASSGIVVAPYTTYGNNCIQLKRNYVQSTGSATAHNFDPAYTWGGHGYDLGGIHNLQVDFSPSAYYGLPYASWDIRVGPGYVGAYIHDIDNTVTAGTRYLNAEGTNYDSHCHNTGYLRADGTAFANGSAANVTAD